MQRAALAFERDTEVEAELLGRLYHRPERVRDGAELVEAVEADRSRDRFTES